MTRFRWLDLDTVYRCQRTAYRYAAAFVVLAPLLMMRFEVSPKIVRDVCDLALLLLAMMLLIPPPGGLMTLFERDGRRS